MANAPLPIIKLPERDAGQDDPGEERRGHVPLAFAGAAPIEIGAHLDRGRLLPAGTAETLGPDHHRPRRAVVLVEVGQDVVLDLAPVDVGEQVAPPSWWRAPRGTTVTTSSIGSSSGPSSTWIDPEKCSAAASMSSARRDSSSSSDPSSAAWGDRRRARPGPSELSGRSRQRRRDRRSTTASRSVVDVLVLDRLTHELVDRLQHAGVVPGVLVVFVIVDRRRDGSQTRHVRTRRRSRSGSGSDGADRDVLLLGDLARRRPTSRSDSQSTSRMGAKNLSRSSNRSSPPGLSSATRPP